MAGLSVLGLASSALAQGPSFSDPVFLPGDVGPDTAAGMQMQSDIARGGDRFLAVWSDYRTSPNDFPPFASEGSGSDIYGVRLDAAGLPIDASPIVIDQAFADQREPRVAWNGPHWLVVYESPVLRPARQLGRVGHR